MRGLFRFARSFAIIALLVGANGLLLTELIGVPYTGFAWKVFAQAYNPGFFTDTDGDGIPDTNEPTGRVNFFDPSGCFYEIGTGEIRAGGRVEVVSSPFLTQEDDGFDDGCYSYVSDSPGLFTLSVTPPPFCILAPGCQPVFECPASGTCTPETRFNPNAGQAVFLGSPVDMGNPAFLESGECTPYFLEVQLDDSDLAVAANNIAVQCDLTPAPAVSGWGWALLGIALLVVAYWGLRREAVLQS